MNPIPTVGPDPTTAVDRIGHRWPPVAVALSPDCLPRGGLDASTCSAQDLCSGARAARRGADPHDAAFGPPRSRSMRREDGLRCQRSLVGCPRLTGGAPALPLRSAAMPRRARERCAQRGGVDLRAVVARRSCKSCRAYSVLMVDASELYRNMVRIQTVDRLEHEVHGVSVNATGQRRSTAVMSSEASAQ